MRKENHYYMPEDVWGRVDNYLTENFDGDADGNFVDFPTVSYIDSWIEKEYGLIATPGDQGSSRDDSNWYYEYTITDEKKHMLFLLRWGK